MSANARIPAALPHRKRFACHVEGCRESVTLSDDERLPSGWRVRETGGVPRNWAGGGSVSLTRRAIYTCPACAGRNEESDQ